MKYVPVALWVVCVCAAFISVFFVIQPEHTRIMTRLATRNTLEAQIQEDFSLLSQSKKIIRRSRAAQAVVQQSGVNIGTSIAIGRSLSRFATLAKQLHIGIDTILVDPTAESTNDGPLMTRGVHLVLHGSFAHELRFLRRMTRLSGLTIRLNTASFSAQGSGADVIAKASISLLSSLPIREGKR